MQVVPSPRNAGISLGKEYLDVLNQTYRALSYESVRAYVAAREFAEGVRRATSGGDKPDRAEMQKAFESVTDVSISGFRINLRPQKYE